MYVVYYNGRTSFYVRNYFRCRIQPAGLLYDAQRDLLTIAKFLVSHGVRTTASSRILSTIPYNLSLHCF